MAHTKDKVQQMETKTKQVLLTTCFHDSSTLQQNPSCHSKLDVRYMWKFSCCLLQPLSNFLQKGRQVAPPKLIFLFVKN